MANRNAPFGLSPFGYLNGSPWNGQARMYCIPSTDSTNAYAIGDPVVLAGSADAKGIPTVTLATAGYGNAITGVIVGAGGIVYGGPGANPNNLNTTVVPVTKAQNYYVLVADDPNILFMAQEDSVGNNLAATDVGSNIDLVAGTNSGYLSGWMIDSSTANTGSTRQLQLMQFVQTPDNAIGTYGRWVVRINNHSYSAGIAGV